MQEQRNQKLGDQSAATWQGQLHLPVKGLFCTYTLAQRQQMFYSVPGSIRVMWVLCWAKKRRKKMKCLFTIFFVKLFSWYALVGTAE